LHLDLISSQEIGNKFMPLSSNSVFKIVGNLPKAKSPFIKELEAKISARIFKSCSVNASKASSAM
jgi:hypothetical protein